MIISYPYTSQVKMCFGPGLLGVHGEYAKPGAAILI